MEQTTSLNSCFLKGRGSEFGSQTHISVSNAMD